MTRSTNRLLFATYVNSLYRSAKYKLRCFMKRTDSKLIKNTYQLLLTNPRDALHHGERTANKKGERSL